MAVHCAYSWLGCSGMLLQYRSEQVGIILTAEQLIEGLNCGAICRSLNGKTG
jgi:hypothetical protein